MNFENIKNRLIRDYSKNYFDIIENIAKLIDLDHYYSNLLPQYDPVYIRNAKEIIKVSIDKSDKFTCDEGEFIRDLMNSKEYYANIGGFGDNFIIVLNIVYTRLIIEK